MKTKIFFLLTILTLLISFGNAPCAIAEGSGSYVLMDLTGKPGSDSAAHVNNIIESQAGDNDGTCAIEFEMSIDKARLEHKNTPDAVYSLYSFKGCLFTDTPGLPKLPVVRYYVKVPEEAFDISVSLIESEHKEILGEKIYPVPRQVAKTDEQGLSYIGEEFVKDEEAYRKNASYPLETKDQLSLGVPIKTRFGKGLAIDVFPVSYNPIRDAVTIYTRLKVRVTYRLVLAANIQYSSPSIYNKTRKTKLLEKVSNNIFINSYAESSAGSFMYAKDSGGLPMSKGGEVIRPTNLRSSDNAADYLIITADPFYNSQAMNTFAGHRALHSGLDVAVVRLSDIYAQFPKAAGYEDESIKEFITVAYNGTWARSIQYVLLVGDADQGKSAEQWFLPTHTASFYVTDNWYACLDGDGTVVPDVMLGRFSVKNESELAAITQKTIAFDNDSAAAPNSWGSTMLLYSGYGVSDVAGQLGPLFEDIKAISSSGVSRKEADELYAHEFTGSDPIVKAVGNGYFITTYRGHGGANSWSWINSGQVALCRNTNRGIVFSMTCQTGMFDLYNEDCLGESFVKNPSGGAVAFFGGTRNTSGNNGPTLDIFEQIITKGNCSLGSVIMLAKTHYSNYLDFAGLYNLLGDPALDFSHVISSSTKPEPNVKSIVTNQYNASRVAGPVSHVDFTVDIENKGVDGISGLIVGLLIQRDDGTSAKITDINAGDLSGCAEPTGSSKRLTYRWGDPEQGTYDVAVCVDPDNSIDELFERDKAKTRIQNMPYLITVRKIPDIFNSGSQFSLNGDMMIWVSFSRLLQCYDFRTGKLSTIPSSVTLRPYCDLNDGKIVSVTHANNYLYFYDINTGIEKVTNIMGGVGSKLFLSDTIAAWIDYVESRMKGYLVPEGPVVTISTDRTYGFDIYSNTAVWHGSGYPNTYATDISTGGTRLLVNAGSVQRLALFENTTIMEKPPYLYRYDLTTDVLTKISGYKASFSITPDIHGQRVPYSDSRNGERDIYVLFLDTGYDVMLTNTKDKDETFPKIFGNRVVWTNLNDIYVAEIKETTIVIDIRKRSDIDGDGKDEPLISFGEYGLWMWDGDNGWTQVHTVSPESTATADIDGDGKVELIADYGIYGLWTWDKDNTEPWTQIHTVSTESVTPVDIDGDNKKEAIMDYGVYGVYSWEPDNINPWTLVYTVSPEEIVSADIDGDNKDEAFFDYGIYGVWTWEPDNINPWTLVHTVSPESIVTGDIDGDNKDEAFFDYGIYGLWTWDNDIQPPWIQIHTVSPESVITADIDGDGKSEAIMNYGVYGYWSWDNDNPGYWTQIHG